MTVPVAVQRLRDRAAFAVPAPAVVAEQAARIERRATATAISHRYATRLLELIAGQEAEAPDVARDLRVALATPGSALAEVLILAAIAWPSEAHQASLEVRHVA